MIILFLKKVLIRRMLEKVLSTPALEEGMIISITHNKNSSEKANL